MPDGLTALSPTDLGLITGLKEALGKGLVPVEPIELSPAKPFVKDRAALVFVSQHLLDASKDNAIFGYLTEETTGKGKQPLKPFDVAHAPHSGACVVAWFRPVVRPAQYVITVRCTGQGLGYKDMVNPDSAQDHFTLTPGEGGQQVTTTAPWSLKPQRLGLVFLAGGSDLKGWFSFVLSATDYWRFLSCEFSLLK